MTLGCRPIKMTSMTNVIFHKRSLYILAGAIMLVVLCGIYVLWPRTQYLRKDGWYVLSTLELPGLGQVVIVADTDIETWNRVLAWEWQRDGKCIDKGYLGGVEASYPIGHLSPMATMLTEQHWVVYDTRSSTLWGVFVVEENRVRLLQRSEADSSDIPGKIREMLGREDIQWIPR